MSEKSNFLIQSPSAPFVPVVLVDYGNREFEAQVPMDTPFVAVNPANSPVGSFVFLRTEEVSATGRRVYRQAASLPVPDQPSATAGTDQLSASPGPDQ